MTTIALGTPVNPTWSERVGERIGEGFSWTLDNGQVIMGGMIAAFILFLVGSVTFQLIF